MNLITPPENQGQTVEVSYGDNYDGYLYMRIYDRSDRTECWYRVLWNDLPDEMGADFQNGAPPVPKKMWKKCDEPTEDDE